MEPFATPLEIVTLGKLNPSWMNKHNQREQLSVLKYMSKARRCWRDYFVKKKKKEEGSFDDVLSAVKLLENESKGEDNGDRFFGCWGKNGTFKYFRPSLIDSMAKEVGFKNAEEN